MAIGALILGVAPAAAAPQDVKRDPVAEADRAAGPAAQMTAVGTGLVLSHGRSVVRLEREPAAAVTIGSPSAQVTLGVLAQGLARFDRSSAVFTGGDVDFVARGTEKGGQVLATIYGASAPQEFRFPVTVAGRSQLLLSQPDGSVAVLTQANGALVQVAAIAAPWAVDAGGRTVRTHLTISGSAVVQHVDHVGATYPVVADPNVIDCGIVTCSLYIGRDETARIASYLSRYASSSATAIAAAFAVACAPLGGIPAVVCAGLGATLGAFAIDQFIAANAVCQRKCTSLGV